jgi:hypothetical protein|tara:strand:- start:254 stop:544 length:291 start_codon:yes stop_codon:yes gene_type:complete
MKKLLAIIVLGLLWSGSANAFCIEPSISSWNKPSKPSVPYCINEYNNTHTCDDYTISSYNSDISSYNYDVESYVRELENFVRDAQNYANCEIRSLN